MQENQSTIKVQNIASLDFNRAGVALMEIVSHPDLSDWEEAGDYVTKLRNILRFANT